MTGARDAMRAACIEQAGRALAVAHERITAEVTDAARVNAEQLSELPAAA